jgi:hypothetical protein
MSVMDCWGRKPILAFCQILPGLACIFSGLLVENAAMAPLQVSQPLRRNVATDKRLNKTF